MSDSARVVAIFQVGASEKRGVPPPFLSPLTRKFPWTFPLCRSVSLYSSSRYPVLASLFFIIFQHSRWQMYLCPRARTAPFISRVSAGRALIHSVPSRFRLHPLPAPTLLRNPLLPLGPPAPQRPFTSRRTRLPRLSSLFLPPDGPSFLKEENGETLRFRTCNITRAKIHHDFNTFNSFIIRFVPIHVERPGNTGDTFHSTFRFSPRHLLIIQLQ